MLLLSLAFTIKAGSGSAQAFLTISERQNLSVAILMFSCLIGVAVGFFLIPRFHLEGAALTSMVMFFCECSLLLFFSHKILRQTTLDRRAYQRQQHRPDVLMESLHTL